MPGLPASRLGSHLTESFSGSNTVISEAPSSSDVVGPDGGLHGLLTALSCHLSPSCCSFLPNELLCDGDGREKVSREVSRRSVGERSPRAADVFGFL